MSIKNFVKSYQKIMRQDAGVDGDAQRISQLVWMLFLKIYDAREQLWEFEEDNFVSIIPEGCRWSEWAIDNKDGEALTGDDLLDFVNNTLFPELKNIEVDAETEKRKAIVKYVFEDANNYMKNGTLLRQVINILNEIDFTEHDDVHAFNDIYESILKDLQSAGSAGEFYTPRPVTDFMVEVLNPQIHEKIADFACGTGGFLTSILKFMQDDITTQEDKEMVQRNLFGIEKKPLPYLLAITNLILHDIDAPNILHGNSLTKNVRDYKEDDKFDVIAMNPPYGGTEETAIRINFPTALQSSETADLFVALIIYRLKENGRVGIVLPDNFLSGSESSHKNLKEKLLAECNLHTIIRLPEGVFAPYTNIKTNLLFFDKTGATEKIDYYEVPLPEGYRTFSKTKPFKVEHLKGVKKWWHNRDAGDENSYFITIEEAKSSNYNLDVKNPNNIGNNDVSSLSEILLDMNEKAKRISDSAKRITQILEGVEE